MSEKSGGTEITATGLLRGLSEECRRMVDASGLEDGTGGGWENYDCLMRELRKRLKTAESYLARCELPAADRTMNARVDGKQKDKMI